MRAQGASVLSTCGLIVLGLSACALVPDTAKLHDVAPGPSVPLPVPRPHFAHIRPRHRVVASMPPLRGNHGASRKPALAKRPNPQGRAETADSDRPGKRHGFAAFGEARAAAGFGELGRAAAPWHWVGRADLG